MHVIRVERSERLHVYYPHGDTANGSFLPIVKYENAITSNTVHCLLSYLEVLRAGSGTGVFGAQQMG